MIQLKHVMVRKAGNTLFHDLNLEINQGEHWIIEGRNGSGKSTLLQLLAGSTHPVQGEIAYSFIHGHDWDTLYQQRLQNIHFIPTHALSSIVGTGQQMFYQQRYYSIDDSNVSRVRDIFGEDVSKLNAFTFSKSFDITAFLEVPVTRLSNGQLKKVLVMQQLVKNIPRILLLDYPFDGLDKRSREDLSAFLEDLAREFGVQIIMVDHGHTRPRVINRRLLLNNFTIASQSEVNSTTRALSLTKAITSSSRDGEPVVEMRDLTIAYSGKVILSGLDWRVNKGERWALTGNNGTGKTTLFSLIYADHPMAYSQKVFLFGKRRGSGESIWDIKKRINYFGPEQIHYLDHSSKSFTGRQYIIMQPHVMTGKLNELVEFFGAHDYIDLPLRILSSGQLQMVMLMNMFLDSRELLLLDEPFQFLDPHNHARINEFLQHYLNKNITLILITHDERDVSDWTQLRMHLSPTST